MWRYRNLQSARDNAEDRVPVVPKDVCPKDRVSACVASLLRQ